MIKSDHIFLSFFELHHQLYDRLIVLNIKFCHNQSDFHLLSLDEIVVNQVKKGPGRRHQTLRAPELVRGSSAAAGQIVRDEYLKEEAGQRASLKYREGFIPIYSL